MLTKFCCKNGLLLLQTVSFANTDRDWYKKHINTFIKSALVPSSYCNKFDLYSYRRKISSKPIAIKGKFCYAHADAELH